MVRLEPSELHAAFESIKGNDDTHSAARAKIANALNDAYLAADEAGYLFKAASSQVEENVGLRLQIETLLQDHKQREAHKTSVKII